MPRTSPGNDREGELPDHVIDDLLASERREWMLSILSERSSPIVLDDLMRTVLAAERGAAPEDISKQDCSEARTEAYERHLPKLTATAVVKYDSLVGTVELTDESVVDQVDRAR